MKPDTSIEPKIMPPPIFSRTKTSPAATDTKALPSKTSGGSISNTPTAPICAPDSSTMMSGSSTTRKMTRTICTMTTRGGSAPSDSDTERI